MLSVLAYSRSCNLSNEAININQTSTSCRHSARHYFAGSLKMSEAGLALRQIRPAQTRQPGPVILRHQIQYADQVSAPTGLGSRGQSENTQRVPQNSKAYLVNAIERCPPGRATRFRPCIQTGYPTNVQPRDMSHPCMGVYRLSRTPFLSLFPSLGS